MPAGSSALQSGPADGAAAASRRSAQLWAALDVAPWRGRGLTHGDIAAAIDIAAARHGATFRYDVRSGKVAYRLKTLDEVGSGDAVILEMMDRRAQAYRELLQASLPAGLRRRDFTLAVELGDVPPASPELPLFSFQRRRNETHLLLPDIDLLEFGYLEHPHFRDRIRYRDKCNQAIFVGSTTGETLTLEKVEALATPRLRAAQAFKASEHVTFVLPNVVQCDSEATAAAVRALGFGTDFVSWPEQMRYRHILSMDGNGATCSRVAIALHSNSTLLRYQSDYELFYFKGLEPWACFVPVASEADVEAVVADSARDPRRYQRIARAGRRFFRRHLSRAACRRYVAALLQNYVDMLDGH